MNEESTVSRRGFIAGAAAMGAVAAVAHQGVALADEIAQDLSACEVNTVAGPVMSDQLGLTHIHEHIFWGDPGWYGDSTHAFDFDATLEECTKKVTAAMEATGIQTIVEATTNDIGRYPEFLKALSENTGLNIVMCTGYFNEAEGASQYFKFRMLDGHDVVSEIEELMRKEITEGVGDTGIKAGVIKCATGTGEITDYEKMFFQAAAKISTETKTPIVTHTSEGTMGPEQAQLFLENGGEPCRIAIGHMGGNTSPDYLHAVLDQGVYINFDRFGVETIAGCPHDEDREAAIAMLCEEGYADRIMLSTDSNLSFLGRDNEWTKMYPEGLANHYWEHLEQDVLPALKELGVTDEQIELMMYKNPQRFFSA